jgi:hypothetical protein
VVRKWLQSAAAAVAVVAAFLALLLPPRLLLHLLLAAVLLPVLVLVAGLQAALALHRVVGLERRRTPNQATVST